MIEEATVFVIDDDPSVRKALSRLMRSVGLDVEAYPTAQDFLACDPPDLPCCLVLDVRMPGLSGLDLQEELSRRGWEIPIIFITGHGDVPMSVRAMKAGAADFLEKPFHDQDLLDAVGSAISSSRQASSARARRESVRRRVDRLTPREQEVFALVVTGLLNKQVAAKLGITEKTVKVHRARVMEKMEAESLAELVRLADAVGISPSGNAR